MLAAAVIRGMDMRRTLGKTAVAVVAALAGCNRSPGQTSTDGAPSAPAPSLFADSCERLAGVWRNGNTLIRITKDGSVYSISLQGQSLAGPCSDGSVATGTMLGNLSYLQSTDRVAFGGVQYSRTSEEAEAQRAAELQAAEIARQQAQQAQQIAAQERYAEQQRLGQIQANLVNCWNNTTCDELAAAARAYPGDVANAWRDFISRNRITPDAIAERESRGHLPGLR